MGALHLLALTPWSTPPSVYPVEEHFFNATIDHFNYQPTKPATFSLRYYVKREHWAGAAKAAPVFFYAGNEADVITFVNNSGFMFEASREFGALVVFAEHRYYGLSNPFGKGALGRGHNVSFLTVEQAMEDFCALNVRLRADLGMPPETAFIAFGGSYGGNLAMWLRLKQPNLWAGAIASSATPLKHLLRETNAFARIETEAYGNVSSSCPVLVRQGWSELFGQAKTAAGRAAVGRALGLCGPLSSERAADDVYGWIDGALETMVQHGSRPFRHRYGYPYPTQFYNPVPGYPFKVACEGMLRAGTGLGALRAAASVYYNYTGQAGACFNEADAADEVRRHLERRGARDRVRPAPGARTGLEAAVQAAEVEAGAKLTELTAEAPQETQRGWGYQCCTEVYQPMPTDGKTDFMRPSTPNRTAYFASCLAEWGVVPRPDYEERHFWGAAIAAGSNIFLASGQLDPWRAAGIQAVPKGAPDSIIVRIIEGGAHHYDLRGSHAADPPSVVRVREEEKAAMRQWVVEWARLYA